MAEIDHPVAAADLATDGPRNDSPGGLAGNPLGEPSSLPFGLPPFTEIRAEHFGPAFDRGMDEQMVELRRITADPDRPTFANTLVPLERSGRLLERTAMLFFNLTSASSNPDIRALEVEYSPKMAEHADRIRLDPALFARIAAVHSDLDSLGLSAEEAALLERYHLDFVLAGARLDEPERDELRALNQQISQRSTAFQQNLQAATEASAMLVTDPAQLDGLTAGQIAAAAAAAIDRGRIGYLIPLILPTGQPMMAVLTDRAIRRRLHEAAVERADSGENDNGPVAIEIAGLRARRAALLGFATHADAVVADQTAGTSAAVHEMLGKLVEPAVANATREAELLSELASADGVELAPWDWAFYSEKVRAQKYSVDAAALRPYFELERVLRDGVFYAAGKVYGISFELRSDLVGYHPDVRVWEVRNADGSTVGLYLGDFFGREGKRGGAWMNSFVDQADLLGTVAVVVNNLNIAKPAAGDQALLTLDEVNTLFHEFGHALHGLFSRVTYPRLSGTSVPRDFVEFPSQVNEMWALWPEVLANYALHVETGEPLPAAAVRAIEDAALWGTGFATVEYLAATLLDQAWHRITPETRIDDAQAFEAQALRAAGLHSELVPPRYRSTYFQHIFAGGYAAAYYSYIWSEVLDAETVEWFKENGGMNRANGDRFRDELLSVGGSIDPLLAFRNVRGRDAELAPLLRRRGLDRN